MRMIEWREKKDGRVFGEDNKRMMMYEIFVMI